MSAEGLPGGAGAGTPTASEAERPERPDPDRDAKTGRFVPGNLVATDHGLSRPERLDPIARREIRDAVLTDLGGEFECSAVLCALVDDFAQAVVLRDAAYDYLASVGPLTKAGRQRAVVQLYLSASARVERLASQIGTGRRSKPIPSVAEYVEARARAAKEDDE